MTDTNLQCSKCSQVLKNLEFGKCMYCGHPIPEEMLLSEDEADKIIRDRSERWRAENPNDNMWGLKSEKSSDEDPTKKTNVGLIISSIGPKI